MRYRCMLPSSATVTLYRFTLTDAIPDAVTNDVTADVTDDVTILLEEPRGRY